MIGTRAGAANGFDLQNHMRWGPGASTSGLHPLLEGLLSVQAISWVLDHSEARLGPRHVLISIANHSKSDGTGAWPSVRTIARESKLSEREVRYALRELETSGELKTARAKGPSGCNLYSLPLMGQTLPGVGGQKRTGGGQKATKRLSDFAPEPKSIEPSIKQPEVQCEFCLFWFPNLAFKKHQCKYKPKAVAG